MKLRSVVVLCCALFALTVGAASAGAGDGGNSANARLCQKNGWMTLVKSDGTSFASQGECVNYGAEGNTPMTHFQLACAGIAGATWLPSTIYPSGTCEPVAPNLAPFIPACTADGYNVTGWSAIGDESPPIGRAYCTND